VLFLDGANFHIRDLRSWRDTFRERFLCTSAPAPLAICLDFRIHSSGLRPTAPLINSAGLRPPAPLLLSPGTQSPGTDLLSPVHQSSDMIPPGKTRDIHLYWQFVDFEDETFFPGSVEDPDPGSSAILAPDTGS
jgi:hypothetical protein